MTITTIMKKIWLMFGLLTGFTATQLVFAQNAEGVITYEVKINMHRNLPEDRQEMKSMMPEFRTSRDELFFNPNESRYKPVAEEPEEDAGSGEGFRMRIQRPENEIYINQSEFKCVMLQEFMGKKYLIEDSIRMRAWKLGTEIKELHGYVCRQATFYDEERKMNIVGWYSDKFRPFLGPENFNTLPGAVLLIDINEGERIIAAKKIELRPLQKNEMKIPTAKIKITGHEYRKLVKEQKERMRANGGNIIIRN